MPERSVFALAIQWDCFSGTSMNEGKRSKDSAQTHPWTDAQVKQLRALHRKGLTYIRIAADLEGPPHSPMECLVRWLATNPHATYPFVSDSSWSTDETATLIDLQAKGTKWKDMTAQISYHSELNCRVYFYNNHWDVFRKWFPDGRTFQPELLELNEGEINPHALR